MSLYLHRMEYLSEIIRLSDSCFEFTFKVMRNLSRSRLGEEIEISYLIRYFHGYVEKRDNLIISGNEGCKMVDINCPLIY